MYSTGVHVRIDRGWILHILISARMVRTADYNDVKEEIKFENQNSIPHCPALSILSIFYISIYDLPTL
jgi:hypothetical protein